MAMLPMLTDAVPLLVRVTALGAPFTPVATLAQLRLLGATVGAARARAG